MTLRRRDLLLAALLAGVLPPVRGAGPGTPALRFSATARARALELLDGRGPESAVLLLVFGDYEWRGADGSSLKRHGWILQAVAPAQVAGHVPITLDGLAVVAPQTHLYGEMDGAVLDWRNGGWTLARR